MSPPPASLAQPVKVFDYDPKTKVPLSKGQPSFEEMIVRNKAKIRRDKIKILQINIGHKCDLACSHCHVEAGPKRKENMTHKTVDRLIELLQKAKHVHTLDITGGAPEMNPNFRLLASTARMMGKEVIDRCNLTIFYQPGQEDTPEFLAEQGIQIVASLPCYTAENVNKQRGKDVFSKSIKALQKLNELGYGKPGSDLTLNLVYNPVGAYLPPAQEQLEKDYKDRLMEDFGISFNSLYTITNMPIKRYLHFLKREKLFDQYMQLLIDNFNASAAQNVMCTELVSISWNGMIYDCDFNQMMEIPINGNPTTIWDIPSLEALPRAIAFDNHCYGCTAGAGSSCGGSLV